MCGICGILDYSGTLIDKGLLDSMTNALQHRGPDDRGIFVQGPVGLGHRRLSIIDLSSAGHQPMVSSSKKFVISYNGEIYNFTDLKRKLIEDGSVFYSSSDTEVALNTLERFGPSAFTMFNGMFAIALWDTKEERLILARDRFGIKPLYYSILPNGIVFGSEIKAILRARPDIRRVRWQALHEFMFYGNSLGHNTMFAGIRRLPAGHMLFVDRSGCRLVRFWSPLELRQRSDSIDAASYEVRRLLEEAVKRHLVSDVPLGVFLSGGIDSSAITAFARRHYGGRIATYTAAFDFSPETSELSIARRFAKELGTEHHELRVTTVDIPSVVEALVEAHDEPFADAADIPLYLLSRELKGAVTVVLQGDGGDEMFAGYRRYTVLRYLWFWRLMVGAAFRGRRLFRGRPSLLRARRFMDVVREPDPALSIALYMTVESLAPSPTEILSDNCRLRLRETDPFSRYRDAFGCFKHLERVQRMLYIDSQILLPDTFLEKVDKATMAHGIEVRVPMLDSELSSYVMGLPSTLKIRRIQKKYVLRRALRGIVPQYILNGSKMGLFVPIGNWLRGPLTEFLRSTVLDPSVLSLGLFQEKILRERIDEHLSGRRDNWFILYKALLLALWIQRYRVNLW